MRYSFRYEAVSYSSGTYTIPPELELYAMKDGNLSSVEISSIFSYEWKSNSYWEGNSAEMTLILSGCYFALGWFPIGCLYLY